MDADRARRLAAQIRGLASDGLGWVGYASAVDDALRRVVRFDRSCWHSVDPGTVLFTGSLNRDVGCSGSWLAEHEYVIEDVNKWAFLAYSGRCAAATSIATHGDLSRSARHRSHTAYGIGDELRAAFVTNDVYWAAAGFLRDEGEPWFTEDEVRLVAGLTRAIATGARRTLVINHVEDLVPAVDGPGVVVFDPAGRPEFLSPAAQRWIDELVEEPRPAAPGESKIVNAVAARARAGAAGADPLQLAARSRVRTRSGSWLWLYGSLRSGGPPLDAQRS